MRPHVLTDPFSARHEVVRTLVAVAKGDSTEPNLHQIAVDLDTASVELSSGSAASAYAALAGLLRILDPLLRWRGAVLEALPEADRFLRSARERYKLWSDDYRDNPAAARLSAVATAIPTIDNVSAVLPFAQALASVPLPIAVFQAPRSSFPRGSFEPVVPEKTSVDLTVAFLKFQFDGRPASELQYLSPGEIHDLEIEVRVSRWPVEQDALLLTPVSVEPKSTYDFPSFGFDRPMGEAPHTLHQRGRAIVLLPQGVHARPFEFKYTAEFLPKRGEQPVAVVGHRTLLIEGTDVTNLQMSGYVGLDTQLIRIRDGLRRRPGIPQNETVDTLLLLGALCNLAGRAVQDAEFPGEWNEATFQRHVRAEVRRNVQIGADLDEHANAAGGITDLSLRGIPIELKVERNLIRSVDDCEKYFAQTASYAVAKEKRTAILCVLDSSVKTSAPLPAERLLTVREHEGSGVTICVLVMQGNLAKPSALSK